MKVGHHAGEEWEQVLARKRREFEQTGMSFWGYGGNTCHPTHVRSFAKFAASEHQKILLVMELINSKTQLNMASMPNVVAATEFSMDGVNWQPIPDGISVTGSRYAMVLSEIRHEAVEVALNHFEAGIGPSVGRPAEDYLRYRVDKACFVRSGIQRTSSLPPVRLIRKATFVADLLEPYAVLVR